MSNKYDQIMKYLYLEEENLEVLLDSVDKTLDIIKIIDTLDIDISKEPLEYLNNNNFNNLRSKEVSYSNNKNIQTNKDNYFVVNK